ncbi:MAG: flagellar motor switch protein FliM, partial [Lentisphaerae bacterium]
MANILSQEEVDALLGAVERGELVQDDEENQEGQESEHHTVVEYNFR